MLLASLLAFASSASAVLGEPAVVGDIVAATAQCVDAAGKDKANAVGLERSGWVPASDNAGALVFTKPNSVVQVEFRPDEDGVKRTCTVIASLAKDQLPALRRNVSQAFRAQAMEQSANDVIWLFRRAGTRGVQLKSEAVGELYRVQLIAAQF